MTYEPRVTLAELGMERMSPSEIKAWSGLTSVEVLPDYLDRPSISLADAYAIAEQRRKAEAEYRETERRREIQYREAVEELQKRVNAAFLETRTAHLAATAGKNAFGGQAELDGLATNAGLEAARAVLLSAGAGCDGVDSVEYEENGTHNVVPLGTAMPLSIITDYAHSAARSRRR